MILKFKETKEEKKNTAYSSCFEHNLTYNISSRDVTGIECVCNQFLQ